MKLLHDIEMKDDGHLYTVPFLTDVSPKYFRINYPKMATVDSINLVLLDDGDVSAFDIEQGRFELMDADERIQAPEILCIKMIVSVPIEVLMQWMTWPHLASENMVKIIKARMEGLI
jgi:hypothetical protein